MLSSRDIVNRINGMVPELKTVTLYSVQPGEALGTGVAWTVKRKQADKETLLIAGAQIGSEHRLFQFLQAAQTTPPAIHNRVVDWNGDTWFIKHIDQKMGDRVHDCLCLKAL
jgi:hypothetical protein